MITVKAKINQEKIPNNINKTNKESRIDESRINLFLDGEILMLDIMYDGNILLYTMDLTNYIDVEFGWC